MWATHPELENVIKRNWEGNENIPRAIPEFTKNVIDWNKTSFENIFKKKIIILILRQEEEFWKLKSRISSLNEGDASTRFFHNTTLNRRSNNRITILQTENGEYIDYHIDILRTTHDLFKNLFHTSHAQSSYKLESPDSTNINMLAELGSVLTSDEIKSTVYWFKPFKAPGLDGLPPYFYKKNTRIQWGHLLSTYVSTTSSEGELRKKLMTLTYAYSQKKGGYYLKRFSTYHSL